MFCPPNLKEHQLTHAGEKSHRCEDCRKVFCAHLELSGHQKNHTGEKVHKCGKASTKLFNLTQHKGVHSIQKHYSWENAGKVFTLQSLKNITEFIRKRDPTSVRDVLKLLSFSLIKLKWIHRREKPSPCEECGKGFTNNSTLCNCHKIYTGKKHYRYEQIDKTFKGIGTEEKPYNSKVYYEGFISFSSMMNVTEFTSGRIYKCAEYSQVFSCNLSLHKHERVPQKCKEYGKAFSCFSYFNYPQRLHTGENLHIKIMCHILIIFQILVNTKEFRKHHCSTSHLCIF